MYEIKLNEILQKYNLKSESLLVKGWVVETNYSGDIIWVKMKDLTKQIGLGGSNG